MTPPEVAGLVARVGAIWPNWRPPVGGFDLLVEEWSAALEHVEAEAAVAAVRAIAVEGREWPPPLGLLVTTALRMQGHPVPPDAEEAWGEVEAAVMAVGAYGKPEWSHESVREGVRAVGGFQTLCRSEQQMADRAHFLRLYDPIRRAHLLADCASPALRKATRDLASAAALALGPGEPGFVPLSAPEWDQAGVRKR